MAQKIKVLTARPGLTARVEEIPNTLQALQGLVDGYIECRTLVLDGVRVLMIVNEEGKLNGLHFNLYAADDTGFFDAIFGTAVFCGTAGEEFDSITPEQLEKVKKKDYPDSGELRGGKAMSETIHIARRHRMTAKRFRKLMMAYGMDKRTAEHNRQVGQRYGYAPVEECIRKHTYDLLTPEQKLLCAIFGYRKGLRSYHKIAESKELTEARQSRECNGSCESCTGNCGGGL